MRRRDALPVSATPCNHHRDAPDGFGRIQLTLCSMPRRAVMWSCPISSFSDLAHTCCAFAARCTYLLCLYHYTMFIVDFLQPSGKLSFGELLTSASFGSPHESLPNALQPIWSDMVSAFTPLLVCFRGPPPVDDTPPALSLNVANLSVLCRRRLQQICTVTRSPRDPI